MKLDKKLEKLPESIDPDLDLNAVRKQCQELVRKRAYMSAGVAVVPVPFADVVVDAGILSQLIPEISERFGLVEERLEAIDLQAREIHWQEMRSRALEFAGMVATRGVVRKSINGMFGKILSKQVAKFVPLGGQMVAASLGYVVLSKVANDHIDECYRLAKKIQDKQKAKLA